MSVLETGLPYSYGPGVRVDVTIDHTDRAGDVPAHAAAARSGSGGAGTTIVTQP